MLERDYHTGLDNSAVEIEENPGTAEDLPMHPLQAAPEPADAGVARSHLHPVDLPVPPSNTATDLVAELEDFAAYIGAMTEEDYGDWMRRANMYWMHLRESLLKNAPELHREYIEKRMAELKEIIQYCPTFQILETKRQVVSAVLEMRKHFGGEGDIDLHKLQISTAMHTIQEGRPLNKEIPEQATSEYLSHFEPSDLSMDRPPEREIGNFDKLFE